MRSVGILFFSAWVLLLSGCGTTGTARRPYDGEAPLAVRVLVDERCKDDACDLASYTHHLTQNLMRVGVRKSRMDVLDFSQPEAKHLYDEAGGKGGLPMFIFDSSLDAYPEALRQLERFLRPVGGGLRVLDTPSTWYPTAHPYRSPEGDGG